MTSRLWVRRLLYFHDKEIRLIGPSAMDDHIGKDPFSTVFGVQFNALRVHAVTVVLHVDMVLWKDFL